MAKGKDTTTKPAKAKAKAPKLQTITNTTAQHRTVGVGLNSVPMPAGSTSPFPEATAAWCKRSAVAQVWIKEGLVVIRDVEDEAAESGEE